MSEKLTKLDRELHRTFSEIGVKATNKELAEYLGWNEGTVNYHRRKLEKWGIIKKSGRKNGSYTYEVIVDPSSIFSNLKHKSGEQYTKQELLEALEKWTMEHGKSPTMRDIDNDPHMPSTCTYHNNFGSFNKAKELLGLETYTPGDKIYSDEQLLELLIKWTKKHRRPPYNSDLVKDKSMPNPNTYWKRFNSLNNAKKLVGLPIFEHDSKLNYIGALLKEWKKDRKKRIAQATLHTYLKNLKQLEEFLYKKGKIMQEISIIDIENYINSVKELYARGTIKTITNAINNLLEYCRQKKKLFVDEDMINDLKDFFRVTLRQIEDLSAEEPALSEDEVKIIKKKLKDYPLFDTMFRLDLNLGLRAGEFAKIKIKEGLIKNRKQARKGDVWLDLNRGIIMIYRNKTRRPHLVALTQGMLRLVKKQLKLRKLYRVNHEYLFFSKTGKRLTNNIVFTYYQKISDITGIKVTSHKVRRTMSTMLEKRGVPHGIIRFRIGHKPKDTTQYYQRYPINERQEILEEKVRIL